MFPNPAEIDLSTPTEEIAEAAVKEGMVTLR